MDEYLSPILKYPDRAGRQKMTTVLKIKMVSHIVSPRSKQLRELFIFGPERIIALQAFPKIPTTQTKVVQTPTTMNWKKVTTAGSAGPLQEAVLFPNSSSSTSIFKCLGQLLHGIGITFYVSPFGSTSLKKSNFHPNRGNVRLNGVKYTYFLESKEVIRSCSDLLSS